MPAFPITLSQRDTPTILRKSSRYMCGKPGISPSKRVAELHLIVRLGPLSAAGRPSTPHRIPIETDTGAPPPADDEGGIPLCNVPGTVARIRNLRELRSNWASCCGESSVGNAESLGITVLRDSPSPYGLDCSEVYLLFPEHNRRRNHCAIATKGLARQIHPSR